MYLLQLSLCPKRHTDLASDECSCTAVGSCGLGHSQERKKGKKKKKKKALIGHVAGPNQHAAFLKTGEKLRLPKGSGFPHLLHVRLLSLCLGMAG